MQGTIYISEENEINISLPFHSMGKTDKKQAVKLMIQTTESAKEEISTVLQETLTGKTCWYNSNSHSLLLEMTLKVKSER